MLRLFPISGLVLLLSVISFCTVFANTVSKAPENEIPAEALADKSEGRGIWDSLRPTSTTTTAKSIIPTGIPGVIPGEGRPKMLVGMFQAVLTNFDPNLVSGVVDNNGLPGLGVSPAPI